MASFSFVSLILACRNRVYAVGRRFHFLGKNTPLASTALTNVSSFCNRILAGVSAIHIDATNNLFYPDDLSVFNDIVYPPLSRSGAIFWARSVQFYPVPIVAWSGGVFGETIGPSQGLNCFANLTIDRLIPVSDGASAIWSGQFHCTRLRRKKGENGNSEANCPHYARFTDKIDVRNRSICCRCI